jgi:ATP-binding cassette subfamily B protein
MEKEVRQMSIKEMWNYLIFQTKGYRQLGAAIVAGAVCGAGISYINSILYARIIDTLLLEQYTTAVHYVWIMILAVLVVRMVYIMCNQIFEQYASPSRDETKRRTAEKAFSMEFEEIEKEENQIAFRRTRGGANGAGDIETQLDSIYKFFTECVKVLFALVFLLILIVQSMQGQHVAAWKIFLMTALLAGMFAFSFWVNVRVSDRIGKKQVELNHENERINFLYGYLFKIFTSETAAKDIRLYGMQQSGDMSR